MNFFLDSLAERLAATWRRPQATARAGHNYRCTCGRPAFFRNSQCLGCQAPLGFVVDQLAVVTLTADPEKPEFTVAGAAATERYRRCGNFDGPAGCNWMVPVTDPEPLCRSCRLNRTIPDLSVTENGELWRRVELAKRRLVAQLLRLGLPLQSRVTEDPDGGLMFDFLRTPPGAPRILTGHDNGLITLNVEEADDAIREKFRTELREPYRTLLGHLRHEVGHYYWDRLVDKTSWQEPFRTLFGDERADYAEALKKNYEAGPTPDWAQSHVSSYASVHPWEDWAETFAHYLHTVDALNTALGFGLDVEDLEFESEPFTKESLFDPDSPDATRFLALINSWVELTAVLNELARSMGQPDLYPFVLSKPAVKKLHFVHLVVLEARQMATASPAPQSVALPETAESCEAKPGKG